MEPSKKKKAISEAEAEAEVSPLMHQPDILIKILSRVPTKKVFQFRCVSPLWRSVLTEPYFVKFLKSSPFVLMHNVSAIDPNADRWSGLLCIEIDNYCASSPSDIVFRLPFDLPTRAAEIGGSCNGLLCLFERYTSNLFYVFNPVTGEYVCVPKPPKVLPKLFFYGFGFASASKVWKLVIAIPQPDEEELEVLVHTIGTGQWRTVTVAITTTQFPTLEEGDECFGTYNNGIIFWLASNAVLWGFDVEEETHRELELPIITDIIKPGDEDCIVNLGLLKQSLCILVGFRGSDTRIHVFLKKKKKNKNVVNEINEDLWKHKFIMSADLASTTRPLLFTKKRQLLMFHEGNLAAFTHGRKGLTKVVLGTMRTSADGAFVHNPSFASLTDTIHGLDPRDVNTTRRLEYPARSM